MGWGQAGTRPEFDLVKGISAGALIAPIIFLGRDYDSKLAGVFTEHSGSDIYEANVLPEFSAGRL